jgi:hypothetical protein
MLGVRSAGEFCERLVPGAKLVPASLRDGRWLLDPVALEAGPQSNLI